MTRSRPQRQDSGPEAEALLAIARLGRPHGVRGEIRGQALCPPVLNFEEVAAIRPLWLRVEGEAARPVEIAGMRPHQQEWLITLEGLDVREEADELRGAELCLERRMLPELPEGWYWETDLIGLPVEDAQLGAIGTVTGLEERGAQSVLRVGREGGGFVDVPWTRGLVKEVDLAGGRIRVDLPAEYPGLSEGV